MAQILDANMVPDRDQIELIRAFLVARDNLASAPPDLVGLRRGIYDACAREIVRALKERKSPFAFVWKSKTYTLCLASQTDELMMVRTFYQTNQAIHHNFASEEKAALLDVKRGTVTESGAIDEGMIATVRDLWEANNRSAKQVAIDLKLPPGRIDAVIKRAKRLGLWVAPRQTAQDFDSRRRNGEEKKTRGGVGLLPTIPPRC